MSAEIIVDQEVPAHGRIVAIDLGFAMTREPGIGIPQVPEVVVRVDLGNVDHASVLIAGYGPTVFNMEFCGRHGRGTRWDGAGWRRPAFAAMIEAGAEGRGAMPDNSNLTIIRGGQVLDIARHQASPQDILVEGDSIREIGPPGLAAPEGAALIEARDRLLMPGLINAHTHGHGGLSKGMGDLWTLELLLHAGPWISGNWGLEHKYLGALVSALEMVRKGCTACYDLYLELPVPSEEGMAAVRQAYADAGMRAVVAPMIADRTFYQAVPGLMAAIPDALRGRVEAMQPASYEDTVCRLRADPPGLARRPRGHPAGDRADHSPSLFRGVPPRLPRPRLQSGRRPAHPHGGIEAAGRGRPEALRQDPDRVLR